MWAVGITLHLAAFGCFPNGTCEPDLSGDFKAPPGTDKTVATLLENLLKHDPAQRWSPSRVQTHIELTSALARQKEAPFSPSRLHVAIPSRLPQRDVLADPRSLARHLYNTSALSDSPIASPGKPSAAENLASETRKALQGLC